jgi:UDP-N-acetylglucosamine 3-dehydrogenase
MDRLQIGIVGCGAFGESHLLAFRAIPEAEVTAVYDTARDRAEAVARQFGVHTICASLDELCRIETLDAIDVVASEDNHLEPVLEALRARKPVFVEKPMALDLRHCQLMIEAADVADQILMVGQILRFETKYALLKQEIDSGRLGTVVSMYARRNYLKSALEHYSRVPPAIEDSIHDIDLMLWYTGQRVTRVRGYGRKATGGPHHDVFWGVLEFEGGAIGVVETIWLLPTAAGITLDHAFQVFGDKGVGNISFVPGGLAFWREDGFEIPDISYEPHLRGAARGALRDELAYFCQCVRNRCRPEIITPWEAKNAVRLALALVESANEDRDVEILDWN